MVKFASSSFQKKVDHGCGLEHLQRILIRIMFESFFAGSFPAQLEVYLLYCLAGASILLRNSLLASAEISRSVPLTRLVVFLVEFICVIVPMILAQTMLADHYLLIFITLVLFSVITISSMRLLTSQDKDNKNNGDLTLPIVDAKQLFHKSVICFR